jgi:uncharacterized coiled-coil protein SlyX
MRALTLVLVLSLVALSPAAAAAQATTTDDAAALRKEIEQLQKQLESVTDRLKRLEAQPPAPSPGTAPPPSAGAPPATAQQPAPQPGISVMDIARPRQPFGLYQQRGAGQLLFDMGVVGDFVGNLTQKNVEKAGGGSFPGLENRFFPREIELSFFGQIDPYASAVVRIEAGEQTRGGDITVNLAEAYLTLLTLPFGTQLRMGQVRNRFGWSNEIHEHDLPWVDRPNVMRNFLGEEGLVEQGFEATFVPDLPFYVEALGGIFNGDNETAFGAGTLRVPLITGRVRTFLELGTDHALELGMSVASGQTSDHLPSTILGWEGRYKYRPDGWLHPLITVTGEALYSIRQFNVQGDPTGTGVIETEKRQKNSWGWYVGGEVQPWRRWAGGFRYDWSQFLQTPGLEQAIEPYISFWPSEFLRFRLAYKHTARTTQTIDAFNLNGGSARTVDELFFQASFILGAHPAHPF